LIADAHGTQENAWKNLRPRNIEVLQQVGGAPQTYARVKKRPYNPCALLD
jgi:hypothetical protein